MLTIVRATARLTAGLALAWLIGGCSSVYYNTLEKFGYEKRDILAERVAEAQSSQTEAKQQFESALQQFQAVTGYQGGELESQYRSLKEAFEDSEDKAREVRERIDRVEQVGDDLFAEWERELEQYQDPQLRRASARQLRETRERYSRLLDLMQRAEQRMDPVLAAFRDRVLFLKHNLNARAIASLRDQRAQVEDEIAVLIRDMNRSIAEADRFLQTLK